ncbi:bifunctional heptose 7-phosphate kinase/heptose 1-phosphate adenyltransferase [Pasteurella multocida subsp. multocida str. Anand1_cattle]|nr:bifunctional heptose 7-phosphate kinase/heptose 1-phosphate adenyltransferase [Pasteurella multocida subsp. multocida str. Anand1_cattle]
MPVKLLGLTGRDETGLALESLLAKSRIECDFVQLHTHPTITKLRILSRHQQLLRLDFEEDFQNVTSDALLQN